MTEHLKNAFKISINYNIPVVTNLYSYFFSSNTLSMCAASHQGHNYSRSIYQLCLFTHLHVPVGQGDSLILNQNRILLVKGI